METGARGAPIPGVSDARACFAGPELAYVVTGAGAVRVLGRANDYFCLGVRADPGQVIGPTDLPGVRSPSVIVNDGVSGFALAGEALWGWGANNAQRLSADPSVTGYWEPQVLAGPAPLDLDTSFAWHTGTVAIDRDGSLIGWGERAAVYATAAAPADRLVTWDWIDTRVIELGRGRDFVGLLG
ncbi:hypothetical protein [Granulicoccus phenolivorans]|uniref:hypothetical protein n=1 Tax=Granulicoccus phenolivorans TaxID=266854 RepID=UPI0004206D4B|nr:hypothetical protein [Granulicoccus phenolivorans]